MNVTCIQCGSVFTNKSPSRVRKFCSQLCYRKWKKENGMRNGCFPKGLEPWNKGVKGIHMSPDSEFKKGHRNTNEHPIGTIVIRKDRRDENTRNNKRAYIKVAEPNSWKSRALFIWEQHNGPLANGLLIHHEDRDKLNDTIGNLRTMTRAEHIKEHRTEFEPKRKSAFLKAKSEKGING